MSTVSQAIVKRSSADTPAAELPALAPLDSAAGKDARSGATAATAHAPAGTGRREDYELPSWFTAGEWPATDRRFVHRSTDSAGTL